MREIKTVAVMGSGAVGAYFIRGLSEKLGENLWVIADGERRERYERDGIYINNKRFPLYLRTPQEAKGVDPLSTGTELQKSITQYIDEHYVGLQSTQGRILLE